MDESAVALYIHPAKQAVDLYDTPARAKFGRPYGLMPMGVPALVNLLRDNGITVRGVNFPMEKRLDADFNLRQWLRDHDAARMVLIDLHWYEHSYGAINMAQLVKQMIPDAWVILGGLTASAFADEIVRDFPDVDFVVRGDAERPLLALAQALLSVERGVLPDLSTIPNLTYRQGGEVVETPRTYCATPEDFADFNFIDLDWLEHEDEYYVHEYLVIDMELAEHARKGGDISQYRGRWLTTARGCDFECSYCGGARSAHKAIAGRNGIVPVPVETIVSQIKQLLTHDVIQVCFSYDLAAMGERYWKTLFRTIRKEGIKIGLYNEFFQLPPSGFMKEFVRTADMAHSEIALNPYSGSERVRRLNGKRYNDAQLLNALDEVNLYNVPMIVYFSLNLPGEDEQAVQESIDLAEKLYSMYPHSKMKILNSCHTVEPKSPMEQRPGRYGVDVQWHTFRDWYDYCLHTQIQQPGARTGDWRGFELLPPAERSVEAMADAWDEAARDGKRRGGRFRLVGEAVFRRVPVRYLAQRLLTLLVVIWFAATVNFALTRITAHDPILENILEVQALTGGQTDQAESLLAFYTEWADLNQPLWQQYVTYLRNMTTLNFGRSFRFFWPVTDIVMDALPYTVVLLTVATILAFVIGTALGAWIGWRRDAKLLKALVPVLMIISSMPPFIVALVVIYIFAFRLRLFPFRGSYSIMITVDWTNPDFLLDVLHHSALPVFTMVLVSGGVWALWMRGMIVTIVGEDFMRFAEAKGLKRWRRFYHYAVRNALLPQVTQLALSLGSLVSGYALVETMFSYPGVGHLLSDAILAHDYAMIQGIIFFLIVAIAVATFLLDMTYPLLDPRISYNRL